MATTLTPQNKQTLKRLLKTGRWNNESEIMRYGLHLVDEEAQSKQRSDLSPMPTEELAAALKKRTRQELAEERRMAKASMRLKPSEKDSCEVVGHRAVDFSTRQAPMPQEIFNHG